MRCTSSHAHVMHTSSPQPVITDLVRRGHQLLADLMTVNTGMGRAVRRWNDYESEHGHLPTGELRTLAGLLFDLATELDEHAGQFDRVGAGASPRRGVIRDFG
jgi:hypothetical protein